MGDVVALAVLHGDPPVVLVAEDVETLNWRIAIEIVAHTDPGQLAPGVAEALRRDLLDEQWGAAVERWIRATDQDLSVYPSWELHRRSDVALAPAELQFTALFRTG